MLVTPSAASAVRRPSSACTDGRRTVWCDLRVGRHVFEVDGRTQVLCPTTGRSAPKTVLWDEKTRQDFITGFKLGVSRITAADCTDEPEPRARRRLLREYADTCARFGTDISDLAPYRRRTRPLR